MNNRTIYTIAAILIASSFTNAHAIPIEVEFTAEDFFSAFGPQDPAPTDPVTGSVIYEAASLGSPIDTLISISLILDGFTWDIADVGNFTPFGDPRTVIGGLVNGGGAGPGTNDFLLIFDIVTGIPALFAYTSAADAENGWLARTQQFTSFTQSPVQVPEPGTLTLFGIGLLGIGLTRRRSML